MKTKILILLTLISMSCFSQSISEIVIYAQPLSNPFTIKFKVKTADTISLNFYDMIGKPTINFLNKERLTPGTYQIDYNLKEGLTSGMYKMVFKTTKDTISKLIVCQSMIGSSNPSDLMKMTFTDSIKVYDTTKVSVFDTTKVLIIDTLNCIKTATNLRNYETFPSTESIVFHDNLPINFSGVDNLVLYDLTGKFIRRLTINSSLINLQDLKNGIYVGLFYESGDIIKTIKMIKE